MGGEVRGYPWAGVPKPTLPPKALTDPSNRQFIAFSWATLPLFLENLQKFAILQKLWKFWGHGFLSYWEMGYFVYVFHPVEGDFDLHSEIIGKYGLLCIFTTLLESQLGKTLFQPVRQTNM